MLNDLFVNEAVEAFQNRISLFKKTVPKILINRAFQNPKRDFSRDRALQNRVAEEFEDCRYTFRELFEN